MNAHRDFSSILQKVDSDGKLNNSQFVELMATSDDADLKRFLKQIFKAFDEDNDGTMNFEQLLMVIEDNDHHNYDIIIILIIIIIIIIIIQTPFISHVDY